MVYFVCFQAFHVSFFVYFSTYLITHATYCKWKKYSWQQNCDENNVEWKLVLQLEIFFHNFSISCLKTLSDGLFNAFFFLFVSVLDYPCNLLQIDKEFLATKLTSRVMKTTWGGKTEEVVVTNNIQQAESTRDALAKGIYSRIFDFLVEVCTL